MKLQTVEHGLPIIDLIVPKRTTGYIKGQETREAILRAALTILIEQGWEAMSMRRPSLNFSLTTPFWSMRTISRRRDSFGVPRCWTISRRAREPMV